MARDFELEITEASTAGDAVALTKLAWQLLAKLEHDDERRARDAARQRGKRRRPRMSDTSATSQDIQGNPQTSADVADGVTQLRALTTTQTHAREAEADPTDLRLSAAIVRVKLLMGDLWPDASDFLLRRKYATWQGWCDAFLRDVGMTSGNTPEDLATVLRDDATLDKKIGGAGVLRVFLGYARRARINAAAEPSGGPAKPATGAPRDEHWKDKAERVEREETERQMVRMRSGNVESRRLADDGPAWWTRMQREAKAAGKNATIYAFDRLKEPANPTGEVAHV